MPRFLTPGEFDTDSFCNNCGEHWSEMVQNSDSSYTCTVCAANHWNGPTAPRDVEPDSPARHPVRGEKNTYNPRNYLYSVLVKASGGGKHKIDSSVLNSLRELGVKEVQEVREAMRGMGLGHRYHTFAAHYAQLLGGYVPVLDQHATEKLLTPHTHFLQRFREMRRDNRLPYKRKHEPHTGMTLRRIAHRTGQHHLETVFRELKSRQRIKTEETIAAVFVDLGWGRPTCCPA